MTRFAFFVFIVLCTLTAQSVQAADVQAPVPATPSAQSSVEVGRLLAREVIARAQGGGLSNGRFTPSVPRAAVIPATSAAAPPAAPSCDIKGLAADTVDENGMRFMPLRRESTRTFKMPARGEVVARAQALQAAVAGSKGVSELAQAALQKDAEIDPHTQAEAEIANITGQPAPAADSNAAAKEAVRLEIQKYRQAHGKF